MIIKNLRYMLLPTRIYKVDGQLLRGNAVFSPIKMLRLKSNKVSKVIDLRNNDNKGSIIFKILEKFYCKLFGIKYENLECKISTKSVPNQDFFDKIINHITQNDSGKTYIHCHYGKHRTNMCVAMYERFMGKCNKNIVKDLLRNFFEGDSKAERLHSKNRKALDIFLAKFFPNIN